MIRRNKKTWKYHAPSAKVTQMALESCFCKSNRLLLQVDELHNMNMEVEESKMDVKGEDPFYFEF